MADPFDYHDDDSDAVDEEDPGDECGRWDNGKLGGTCMLAGTEFCDFDCPHRSSLKF